MAQRIKQLNLWRFLPNYFVFRPCDGTEVVGCYLQAIIRKEAPSILCFSRQNLPYLEGSSAQAVSKGAYQIVAKENPKVILVGTGAEVSILVQAAGLLEQEGVSTAVVSMPFMELFDLQDYQYKRKVFPFDVPVLSMEAGSEFAWHKYAHLVIGMNEFGKSGPFEL